MSIVNFILIDFKLIKNKYIRGFGENRDVFIRIANTNGFPQQDRSTLNLYNVNYEVILYFDVCIVLRTLKR